MKDFAIILRNLRLQRGMSQADLARILSLSRSTISSYENGARTPDRDTLLKIANCFMVSTDFLLGRE
jgi:transcriptional regulator with XRE-family HTH domain